MPQVPQLNSAASADIRPQAPASQRNEPTDGFTRLLNTVGGDTQADAPRDKDAEPVKARPAKNDRADRTDRTDRRNGGNRAEKGDSKADASDTDSTDRVHAKEKSKDEASADAGGEPKDHDKDGKDKADVSPDLTAASQPLQQKALPVDSVVAVVAAVIPAPVATGDSAAGAEIPPADAPVEMKAAAAAAQTPDAKGATGAAAQAGIAAQAALNAGKPASTNGQSETVPQPAAEEEGDTDIVATGGEKKTSSDKPVQTGINAAFNVAMSAMKAVPGAAAQPKQQAETRQTSTGEHSFAANIAVETAAETAAKTVAKADLKPDASGAAAGHESLENSLVKQLSADLHLGSTGQIVLPDATRGVQINPPPVNLQAQAAVMTATNQPVPLASAALAIEIASRSKDGSRQFDIRLDPPELGRIDVKLDVDKDGLVNTRLTVDRPETLNLLQRDAQGLERALQQAGLKTSDGGLEFSLRQQTPDGSMNQRNQAQQQPNGQTAAALAADGDLTTTIQADQYQWAAHMRGGVDIRI